MYEVNDGRRVDHSDHQRLAAYHKCGNPRKRVRSAFERDIALPLDHYSRSGLVFRTYPSRDFDIATAFFQKSTYRGQRSSYSDGLSSYPALGGLFPNGLP